MRSRSTVNGHADPVPTRQAGTRPGGGTLPPAAGRADPQRQRPRGPSEGCPLRPKDRRFPPTPRGRGTGERGRAKRSRTPPAAHRRGRETRRPRAAREEPPHSPGMAGPSPVTRLEAPESTTPPHRSGPPPRGGERARRRQPGQRGQQSQGPASASPAPPPGGGAANNPRTRTPDTHAQHGASRGEGGLPRTPPRVPLGSLDTNHRRHHRRRDTPVPQSQRSGPCRSPRGEQGRAPVATRRAQLLQRQSPEDSVSALTCRRKTTIRSDQKCRAGGRGRAT